MTKIRLHSEVIESPCCHAPSSSMTGIHSRAADNDQRRCIRCRQPFYVIVEEFESDEEAEAVHRIRMAARPRNGEFTAALKINADGI